MNSDGLKELNCMGILVLFIFILIASGCKQSDSSYDSKLDSWADSTAPTVWENNIPTDGLVARYEFNGNANDLSGNDNHATVHDATLTSGKNGQVDSAYNFDGDDDYITLPTTSSLNTLEDSSYTISVWVKLRSWGPNSNREVALLNKDDEGLQFFPQHGYMRLWSENRAIYPTAIGSQEIGFGSFYHFVGVVNKESGVVRFYINGGIDIADWLSNTWSPSVNTSSHSDSQAWRIGTLWEYNPDYTWFLNGVVDSVHMYNRALSSDEIKQLYNGSTASPSLLINQDEGSTYSPTVTLYLSAYDGVGVSGYFASESDVAPDQDDSEWIDVTATTNYVENVPFVLTSSPGTKTVYVWFKDTVGNVSSSVSDSIELTGL
jgi:concanavalin A-like lectin/glucanase superfamily protein